MTPLPMRRTVTAATVAALGVAATATAAPAWTPTASLAPAGSHSAVDAAVSAPGGATVAWITERNCCVLRGRLSVRTRALGTAAWRPVRVLQATGAQLPAAAVNARGENAVAWVAAGSVRVAVRRRTAPATWLTRTVAPAAGTVRALRVAVAPTGVVRVLWVADDAAVPGTRVARVATLPAARGVWTVDAASAGFTSGGGLWAALAPSGPAVATWTSADGSVMAMRRDPATGAWAAPETLDPADPASPNTVVHAAADAAGVLLVTWSRSAPYSPVSPVPTSIRSRLWVADGSGVWEAAATHAAGPTSLGASVATLGNGAAVAWAGECAAGRRSIRIAYRAGTTTPWREVAPTLATLPCGDLDEGGAGGIGVVPGSRFVVLAPIAVGVGPDALTGFTGSTTAGWRGVAFPGEQSAVGFAVSGRFALVVWTRPEDGTPLVWRGYRAP